MDSDLQLQADKRKLFDYCEQCQCFHEAYFKDGSLFMEPCQLRVKDQATQQKILTETNVSTQNNDYSSESQPSINYHFSPYKTSKLNTPQKIRKVISIKEPLKTPLENSSHHRPLFIESKPIIKSNNQFKFQRNFYLPQRILVIKPSFQVTGNFFSPIRHIEAENNRKQLSPNLYLKTIRPNKTPDYQKSHLRQQQMVSNKKFFNSLLDSSRVLQSNNRPHLQVPTSSFYNQNSSFHKTPQFGSQSLISQGLQKQNSSKDQQNLTSYRTQKKTRQPKQYLMQNRIQKTMSVVDQNSDYFCCGYIRKCDK